MFTTLTFLLLYWSTPDTQPTRLMEEVQASLARTLLGERQTLLEIQRYLEQHIPKMPIFKTPQEWAEYSDSLRKDILERIVFRGEAKSCQVVGVKR